MSPAVANSLDIGIGVLALCGLLVFEQVSGALEPPRRHLRSLLVNLAGCGIAVMPEVLSGQWPPLGGAGAAVLFGLTLWGAWEMHYWRYELRRRWAVSNQRTGAQRAYRPTSFGD